MQPLQAYGGDKLLNFILRKVFEQQNNGFSGNGTVQGIAYTYSVQAPPTGHFIPQQNNYNVEILFTVKVTATINGVNFNIDIPMIARGRVSVSGGNLTINQINVVTNSPNPIDQALVAIINQRVLPPLRTRLNNIPMPRLTDIYGSGLSVALSAVNVISNGPCMETELRVIGATGLANATRPSDAELTTLNTANSNRLIATVSDDVVQHIARGLISQIEYPFEKSKTGLGFGARIKGKMVAKDFKFDIVNGVGRAKIKIGFTTLKGGIKAPLVGWNDVNIPKPEVEVTISNSLSVSGNRVIVTLTGVDNISIDLNFPAVLLPVEALLEGLLNVIYRAFHRRISDLIEGTRFELFRLSNNLFGGEIDVNLAFEPNGVQYFENSVKVIIRVN